MREPISPMLATLVGRPFQRKGWINEEKYDGKGVSRFQLLQRRDLDRSVLPVLAVFDCLEEDGREMLREPLSERRTAVEVLIPPRHTLLMRARRLSPDGFAAFEAAKQKGWEGIIAKDEASPYQPGKRSKSWLKVKCRRESEFVIGGFTAPEGHRQHFGALLAGLYDGTRLRYVGKVGTGYSRGVLARLAEKMMPLRTSRCPFGRQPRERAVSWVRPALVAQAAFEEWTKDGRLRQPAFLGLRDDKAASECQWRERDR